MEVDFLASFPAAMEAVVDSDVGVVANSASVAKPNLDLVEFAALVEVVVCSAVDTLSRTEEIFLTHKWVVEWDLEWDLEWAEGKLLSTSTPTTQLVALVIS